MCFCFYIYFRKVFRSIFSRPFKYSTICNQHTILHVFAFGQNSNFCNSTCGNKLFGPLKISIFFFCKYLITQKPPSVMNNEEDYTGFACRRRTRIPWEALWSTGCRRRAASCGRAASYPRFPASHPQNPCRLNQQKIMLFNIDIHQQVGTFFRISDPTYISESILTNYGLQKYKSFSINTERYGTYSKR